MNIFLFYFYFNYVLRSNYRKIGYAVLAIGIILAITSFVYYLDLRELIKEDFTAHGSVATNEQILPHNSKNISLDLSLIKGPITALISSKEPEIPLTAIIQNQEGVSILKADFKGNKFISTVVSNGKVNLILTNNGNQPVTINAIFSQLDKNALGNFLLVSRTTITGIGIALAGILVFFSSNKHFTIKLVILGAGIGGVVYFYCYLVCLACVLAPETLEPCWACIGCSWANQA